ncbi:DUF5452 domain-containing protein [Mycoplasmoides pirum]|uniref:DUF5452 domain-containing protein n=1 Tax=Mycoplasmoides pirum TaxID=2122 RepID=UPI000482DFD2|nr:DUF5452 domain-containing protein [Mycoplasmoides pirum]
MNKKIKKIILWFCTGLMFTTTLILSVTTIIFSNNIKDDNKFDNSNNLNNGSNNENDNNLDKNEEYPESSTELKNLKYPFDESELYLYMYANIHDYLYSNPEWDNLISYRYLLNDFNDNSQQFNIKQDVLFKNLRSWIINAIYQHSFFKKKTTKLTTEIDYKINILEKNILINVVWYFENDYSYSKNLPKRYWDQIIVELSKNV